MSSGNNPKNPHPPPPPPDGDGPKVPKSARAPFTPRFVCGSQWPGEQKAGFGMQMSSEPNYSHVSYQPYSGGGGAGPGPYNGPQAYNSGNGRYPPPPPSSVGTYTPPIGRFFFNQAVKVNIEGHGWLVGCVVALIGAAQSMTGSKVKVKYRKSGQEREDNFPNDPNYIRPCSN